jgi:hypothetical protein
MEPSPAARYSWAMADLARSTRPGRIVFAIAIAGIAAQNVIYRDFLAGFQPAPSWLPLPAVFAVLFGAVGLAAAAGIATGRGVVGGARLLLALLVLNGVAFHVPVLVAHPSSGGAWAVTCEVIALGGISAMLAFPASPIGRLVWAATLPAFGLFHFLYLDYIVSVIPGWIPGHTFFAIASGIALITAGASLLTGVRARLAEILTAVMFGSWVVLLHIPRVLERRHADEWTSLFIATAMCGGAWLLVGRRRAS